MNVEWSAYRYIRVIGYGNSMSDHNSIAEISFWVPDVQLTLEERVPIAISASSHNKENIPEHVIDQNLATHWTADNGEWIQFDIGKINTMELIKIAWLSGNKRKADFDIEVSVDGVNWEFAFSGTSTGAALTLEVNQLMQEFCARYIRVIGLGNDHPTQGGTNSITEVEIWGYERWNEPTCEEEFGADVIEAVADRM